MRAHLTSLGFVAVGAILALLTTGRVAIYHDEPRLWAEAVQRAPEKPRPLINLGRQYAIEGDAVRAEQAFARAAVLATRPTRGRDDQRYAWGFALTNLSVLWAQQGRRNEAITLSATVLQRYPESPATGRVIQWIQRSDPAAF